ncbi:Eco57I restriction-modification methylase domain-containing protein [Haloarcula nitratireducens]|uniref:site-specific DNA-methyltransferase (adenine-specific) n=1 Tax=Haloarcula nitratireducens TaxID=2487749 RepID=A0AAW4PA79_9EURY|nr:TaqI-like C-terminal specificity domain-containing protein [Halomicroarcula nitratireducens]MBX0294810.1 Eco57I restriction-modification methylase domain-containing protein [Halomicroarcula nitratireducens]
MGNDRSDGSGGGRQEAVDREATENAAEALEVLAEGFLEHPDNDLGRSALTDRGLIPDAEDNFESARLDLLYDSSLVYLYRLLVVLYAESEGRNLLETADETDAQYSLDSLKRTIADRLDSADSAYHRRQTDLWSRLDDLFELLDRGSGSDRPEIDENDPSVPAYDGWLFRTDPAEDDPREARFLAEYAVGDAHLARVVTLLTRRGDAGETAFIDYASLDVRQLGSVHESLLQYRLDMADEPLTLTDGTYTAAGDGDDVVVPVGNVYLTADDGERKATGAYYTPEYVVEHVVERTLEPLVRDVRADLEAERARSDGGGRDGARGGSADEFARQIFDLNVLDPAMGSGRFLLAVVEYLAREIVAERDRRAGAGGDESVDAVCDIDRARRKVARRCVYGVDLDPLAVELATASLWLRTAAADRPPASLDRHLKAGNALVGSDLEEVPAMKGEFEQFGCDRHRQRSTAIANVHTAERFGLDTVPDDAYRRMTAALEDDEAWAAIEREEWFREAQQRADDGSYFHWKLEFPETYRDEDGDLLDRPGFDAVVGNPPWVATAGRANVSAAIETDLRAYLEDAFEATDGQFDLYVAFYEQAIRQSRTGRVGFVVPDSVLTREQNEPIRAYVLEHASLAEILQVGAAFEGVESGAVVLVSGDETDAVRCASATGIDRPDLGDIAYDSIPARVFEAQDAKRFLLYLDEDTRSILDQIERQPPLGEFITISRGEEVSKRAAHLAESPREGETRPIAPGGAVRRYGIDEGELRYVEAADLEKAERNYGSPKLVFRQTSASLVGTLDADGLATVKSAYNVHAESGSADDLKHLLGVLNSSVLNFYHHYKHAAYRTVFPQINQSTFEALPMAFDGEPDPKLVDAVDRVLSLTAERSRLDLDLAEHLGTYEFGPSLGALPECQPAEGVSATRLAATADELPNLRIGDVRVESRSSGVVLAASARYKPDDDAVETDRWGYAETDPIPALELDGADDERETLIEAFVPYAADRAEGFADFRRSATQSSSLLARLQSLTLPRLDDVAAGLREFSAERARARELDDRIAETEAAIDRRVCSLYGLSEDERDAIRKEFGDG